MEALKSEYNKNPSATNQALFKSCMEELRSWIAPCNELSSVYRVCLESSGNILAKRIVSQNMGWDDYCTCSHNREAVSIENFYELTD